MKDTGPARRYAKAIIESASGDAEVKSLSTEISSFAELVATYTDLRKVLIHPGIKSDAKQKVVSEIMKQTGYSPKSIKVVATILNSGRINLISEIALSVRDMADEALGQVRVQVTSASPLSEDERKQLEETFGGVTGKKVKLQIKTDKSLIGGVVARVGSKVYDGSLSNQLRLMKVKLEQEA